MVRLSYDAYLRHLQAESSRFREVLADCDLDAPVPSCPEWTAADLLWHLGGGEVQNFWAWIVAHRPAGHEGYPEPSRPDSAAGLFEAFDSATAALTAALGSADPADHAWTWGTEQTVGFIARRQAHEALIHRVDAELAAGTSSDLDPALAADGVEECLAVMYGGCPPWGTFTPGNGLLRFDIADAGESLWVRLGRFTGTDPEGATHDEDDLNVVDEPGRDPDVVVTGPAGPMDAWLWHRGDDAAITVAGDRAVYDRFAALVTTPIS
jgi:uncharacterized protein (TIGR03083 family)